MNCSRCFIAWAVIAMFGVAAVLLLPGRGSTRSLPGRPAIGIDVTSTASMIRPPPPPGRVRPALAMHGHRDRCPARSNSANCQPLIETRYLRPAKRRIWPSLRRRSSERR